MNPTDMTIVAALTHVVTFARSAIPTKPDHANYPDERVRDLLEQVFDA